MKAMIFLFLCFIIETVLASDIANLTLRPWDEDIDVNITAPIVRSLTMEQSSFGDNPAQASVPVSSANQNSGQANPAPAQGPYGSTSIGNQPIGYGQIRPPFGNPVAAPYPQQFGQGPIPVPQAGFPLGGIPPFRYGQLNYYNQWQPQGYPVVPQPINPSLYTWPGMNRQQQFSPFAQQQGGVYPVGIPQSQFGQPMQNAYFGAQPQLYNPMLGLGPQFGQPPVPQPQPYGQPPFPQPYNPFGYFQNFQAGASSSVSDGDERMNSDRRNHQTNENPSSGQVVQTGYNPPIPYASSQKIPLYPNPYLSVSNNANAHNPMAPVPYGVLLQDSVLHGKIHGQY